ncbi:MAG: radical SAM protein, partial [Candidatus Thorarchaeota archaeon]
MDLAYPSEHHPCWSHSRLRVWQRIHLPVAKSCNVKCAFCDWSRTSSCHTPSPGSSRILMNPEEAVNRTLEEIEKRPNLRIVAVSGPGEPLANNATFNTLQGIKTAIPDIHFCISTNGILLANQVSRLLEFDVETVSVSTSTTNPRSAARIYEWAVIDGKLLRGEKMGKVVIKKQLEGICKAESAGIRVKVNTILMPSINGHDIGDLARRIAKAGATLQNIVPLVPTANMMKVPAPSLVELEKARQVGSLYIDQFHHCYQCRS